MVIWLASMECAGIAEAGGVKDVAYALCKGFDRAGEKVTLFIPAYACTSYEKIDDYKLLADCYVDIDMCCKNERVTFASGKISETGVNVIFINHPSFAQKHGVYVYTEEEEENNPSLKKGTGHVDMLFLDTLFSKAVAEYIRFVNKDETPDIVHCHDASAAVIPCYIKKLQQKTFYKKTKCIVTIHNAGPAYHHDFSGIDEARWYTGFNNEFLAQCMNGYRVEPYLLGSTNAKLTTVSTFYADELLNPDNNDMTDGLAGAFFERNLSIEGITNGIDYNCYCPEDTKISMLPYPMNPRSGEFEGKYKNREFLLKICKSKTHKIDKYTKNIKIYGHIDVPEKQPVYFTYHGRIVWQKGLPILLDSIETILKVIPGARFIIGGQGDTETEKHLERITEGFPGKVVFLKGYNCCMARLVAAAGDFMILPSLFEPCGLEDFIAQIYGTLPIAHATGGLKKIIDGETGYLYKDNSIDSLMNAILTAVAAFYRGEDYHRGIIMWAADFIHNVYSWDFVIESKYLKFFKKCLSGT